MCAFDIRLHNLDIPYLIFRDNLYEVCNCSFDFLTRSCLSVTGLSICKRACVRACVRLSVSCCFSISLLQTEQKQPRCLFSPSPSSSWLTLCRALVGYWVHCEVSACLSVCHIHTRIRILLGSLGAKAQTVYSCLAQTGEYFGLVELFLVCAFFKNAVSISAGSRRLTHNRC